MRKLNDIVDCHVWILEANCHVKQYNNHHQNVGKINDKEHE